MPQHSIFGRITQLTRADIAALISGAQDPRKMCDQLTRDYANAIRDAESAIATAVATLRAMEEDAREEQAAAAQWLTEAMTASQRAEAMRATGNPEEGERFDGLARVALRKQIDDENDARSLAAAIADQADVAEWLKDGVARMRSKLDALRDAREELAGRPAADRRAAGVTRDIDVLDPASEISRFEEKIRREEERVWGRQGPDGAAWDGEHEPAGREVDADVETRLAAMKSRRIDPI